MKHWIPLLAALLISGCQVKDPLSTEDERRSPWWELGFLGPSHMLGLVEYSQVIDTNGKVFHRPGGGTVGYGSTEFEEEVARGWRNDGMGGKTVVGAALPQRIFVRWQSLVEPQTYRAWVDIPEHGRQLIHDAPLRRCAATPTKRGIYMSSVYVGVAPGGKVKVWVLDECYNSIEVASAQGEIEPLGPERGENEGRYGYKINESSKRYIERWGIPYGSW